MSNSLTRFIENSFGNTLDIEEFRPDLQALQQEHRQVQAGKGTLITVVSKVRKFHSPNQAPTEEAAQNTNDLRSDLLNVFFAQNSRFPIQRLKNEGLGVTLIGSAAFSEIVPKQSDIDIIFSTSAKPTAQHQALIRGITPEFSKVARQLDLTTQELTDTANIQPFTPETLMDLAQKLAPLNRNHLPKTLLTNKDVDTVGDTANIIAGLGIGPISVQREVGLGIMKSLSQSSALEALVARTIEEEILSRRLKRRHQP